MDIFNNDHQALQIGGLTIENGSDSVLILGNLEICKNHTGKQQAKMLKDFADALMRCFDEIPEEVLNESRASKPNQKKMVNNPFV